MSTREKEITAYHEAGHALIGSVLEYADPVHKVTIISRGNALGYTFSLPLEERKLESKKEFLDDIAVMLGGYAAEQLIFNDRTAGASSDLQKVSAIARAMVTRWGMSDVIGPIAIAGDGGRDNGADSRELSETWKTVVDEEVQRIAKEALVRAQDVLSTHRKVLDAIAKKLIEVETLEQPEYEAILSAHGIPLKKIEKK